VPGSTPCGAATWSSEGGTPAAPGPPRPRDSPLGRAAPCPRCLDSRLELRVFRILPCSVVIRGISVHSGNDTESDPGMQSCHFAPRVLVSECCPFSSVAPLSVAALPHRCEPDCPRGTALQSARLSCPRTGRSRGERGSRGCFSDRGSGDSCGCPTPRPSHFDP